MKTVTDINKRWETGVEHHPKTKEMYRFIADADGALQSDSFCFKSGGDGDNGESLMYLMDIWFDAIDNGEFAEVRALLAAKEYAHLNGN